MFYRNEESKKLLGIFALFILMMVIEISYWFSAITDITLAFVCLLGILKLLIKGHRWSEIYFSLSLSALFTFDAIENFSHIYEKSLLQYREISNWLTVISLITAIAISFFQKWRAGESRDGKTV